MSNEGGVTPVDVVRDTATGGVTPQTCEGALGTWRELVGGSEHRVGGCGHNRGPSPTGKPWLSGGVYASPFKPPYQWEGRRRIDSKVRTETRENRPSGIVGGLTET
jgi:hypothetical protein